MGRLLVAIALVGCAPHATTGPAWPKDREVAGDGGESLAPHVARQVASASTKADDETKPAMPATPAVMAPAIDASAPVVAPAASVPIEDTITTEDIIIEIDD